MQLAFAMLPSGPSLFHGRRGWLVLLPVLGALLAALLIFFGRGPGLVISFTVDSPVAGGIVAVYYDDGGGLREQSSVRRELRQGLQRYEFAIPAARVNGLRVDPANHDAATFVGVVEARSAGKVLKRFAPGALVPGGDVASAQVDSAAQGVRFTVKKGGSDPFFTIEDSSLDAPGGFSRAAGTIVGVAFAVLALLAVAGLGGERPCSALPAVLLALAAGLVAAMATLAPADHSVSPDEFGHLDAARYYVDHWIPPAVGASQTLDTYSGYGNSYLDELDVVYFLSAKVATALEFTGMGEVQRFRLFNFGLLALCLAMALQGRLACMVVLPVLCTPQAWYVFAYFNADAFALVVTVLLAAWVTAWFDRNPAIAGSAARVDLHAALFIGGLLALAVLSKRTFYPFLLFLAGYALWKCGLRRGVGYAVAFAALLLLALWQFAAPVAPAVRGMMDPPLLRNLTGLAGAGLGIAAIWLLWRPPGVLRAVPHTLILAGAVAVALVCARLALDLAVNGMPWDKSQAMLALAERTARPDLRPSVLGSPGAYFGLALEARGVTLQELLLGKYLWIRYSAESLFGVYGYMTIFGPGWLYQTQYILAVTLLCTTALQCAMDREGRGVLLLGLGTMALVVIVSALHSWTRDLQAQGRYLFAILPVLGALMVEAGRGEIEPGRAPLHRFAFAVVTALWLCGMVSFAFFGLPGLLRA